MDISASIAQINAMKCTHPGLQGEGHWRALTAYDQPTLGLLRTWRHSRVLVLVNKDWHAQQEMSLPTIDLPSESRLYRFRHDGMLDQTPIHPDSSCGQRRSPWCVIAEPKSIQFPRFCVRLDSASSRKVSCIPSTACINGRFDICYHRFCRLPTTPFPNAVVRWCFSSFTVLVKFSMCSISIVS